ncbi:hydantoinase B/oxoprolinase family protein [Marinitenerispora sediminis]|uniref:Hydantoinase n=1 Tax=Marinitenerispora sediminis TaxID=1931232 RepID=A0A368T5K3_9ACTN|nr:hydantoinase B/oxoprolinase family protein [Marinitenerispora sediminis]RCV50124.1 hydantoinase [Marinitenerispora sediminis]RCV54541.1 hydantoinase [Marinitenerispora sediminis]RCV58784.1 hydantoinase [Marinitenerispora sediminis]
MRLDPVTLEIIGNKLGALTEEMCLTLQRTSRSLYVKETADFACALAGPDGTFTAYPRGIGVSGFVGLEVRTAVEQAGPLSPGDVLITNDPYHSGGLATHLTDIQLIEPYFHDGEVIGYGWAFIHCSDIGGRVPSSLSPTNDEIYQEGLRIPPVRLVRAGERVPEVAALLAANSRTPDANEGDLRAMLAALRTGRERLAAVVAAHGADGVRAAHADLVEYSAGKATAALAGLRDGEYRFVDLLDDDAVSPVPVRISVTAHLEGGRLHLDFTGSDPQVAAAFNIASHAGSGRAHAWITTRVLALICTLDPEIPLNGGIIRPITVTAPEGSVVNATAPAAVGIRHATASRVNDALGGALGQAAREVLPAASSGLVVPVVVAEQRATGQNVQVLEPMVGGTGARYGADGVDGRDSGISNLSNNPVETVETEIGVRVLRYALRPDSGGPGRWRGGTGLELSFEVGSDDARLLARGLERLRFRPWGVAGGRSGAPAELVVNEGTPGERRLGKIDVLGLARGDVVTLRTSGAGGYGDPFDRPAEEVLADVRRGVVSVAAARRDYGVAVAVTAHGPAVDEAETGRLRTARPPADRSAEVGPERAAWDAIFDPAPVDRLVAALFRLPAARRHARRVAVYTAVLAALPAGFPAVAATPEEGAAARRVLAAELDRLVAETTDEAGAAGAAG